MSEKDANVGTVENTEELVFDEGMTLDQLDAAFDAMYSIGSNIDSNDTDTDVEETEESEVDEVEEVADESIEDNETSQTEETPADTEVSKPDYAFAQLRIERDNARKEAEAKDQEMLSMAQALGFSSVNEMRSQVDAYRLEQERKQKGIPDEQADIYNTIQAERQELEKQRNELEQANMQQRKAYTDNLIHDYVERQGISIADIGQRLHDSGLEYQDIVNSQTPELLLKGLLADLTVKPKEEPVTQPRKTVETKEIKTTAAPKKSEKSKIEELLEADIEEWKKSEGYL